MSDSREDCRRMDFVSKHQFQCIACKNSYRKKDWFLGSVLHCDVANSDIEEDGYCEEYEEM
jgi:hypothetical protein